MAKNVLFIGQYYSTCSWGIAAREYIKALQVAGYNLTLRPVHMGGNCNAELPLEYGRLEDTIYDTYDAVIQNTLPHLFEYNSYFGQNIGLFFTETYGWKNTWPKKIEMMDKLIVPSFADFARVSNSVHNYPEMKVVPIPVDHSKFSNQYEVINEIEQDYYNFYYIGDIIDRKNIEKMITAFHIAFNKNDAVNLVIKTGPQYKNKLMDIISRVKSKLRINYSDTAYKKETIIVEHMSDNDICRLHKSCDCLIMPSSGESWSLVCADAYGFGNRVICTDQVGFHVNSGIIKIPTHSDYVYVDDFPIRDLYTSHEKWGTVLVDDIVKAMKDAPMFDFLEKDKVRPEYLTNTYENVASLLKEII